MKKYIIVVLALALFVTWFISDEPIETTQEKTVQSAASDQSSFSIVSPSSSDSSISHQGQSSQSASSSSVWTYQESLESKTWRHSRGIFRVGELIDYEGFKLDKLEELANKGDLKAIEVLKKFELSSGNHKRYNELVDLAAVHGSLKSIRLLTTKKFGEYTTSRKEEDILEMFAYISLAEKRGDLYFKHKKTKTYSNFFNFYPNEEQQKNIDKRSDELMADLEARRKELGLPPFDNSPLESDRRKYEFMNEDVDN